MGRQGPMYPFFCPPAPFSVHLVAGLLKDYDVLGDKEQNFKNTTFLTLLVVWLLFI